jgi:hypothetical protein
MILQASFGCGPLGQQDLEPPGNSDNAFIFADTDAELDGVSVGVPPGVRRKSERTWPSRCIPLMF